MKGKRVVRVRVMHVGRGRWVACFTLPAHKTIGNAPARYRVFASSRGLLNIKLDEMFRRLDLAIKVDVWDYDAGAAVPVEFALDVERWSGANWRAEA